MLDNSDRSENAVLTVWSNRSETFEVMALIGETKLKILRRLQNETLHGYALAEELDLSHGYIYTHLGELQDEGMIEVVEEHDGKKLYQLTENGEYLLKAFDE